MAGIGLYGFYYSKATLTGGVLTGYTGVKQAGGAITANFSRQETDTNSLWANNRETETDAQAGSGGTLELTLDRLTADGQSDLFGTTARTATVTVDGEEVDGTGYDDTGAETPNPVGVAFIRQHQEDNNRNIHEAVIYSYVTFTRPEEDAQTIGADGVTWQTPELSGAVSGPSVTGTYPWRKKYRFTTQAAAEQFIADYFAAPTAGGEA